MKSRCLSLVLVLLMAACVSTGERPVAGKAKIIRDDFGVAHVYADDTYGLFFGYGYAIAEDRLFQMEMARRSTQGMVAEVLGSEFVDFDIAVRRGFSPESIRAQIAKLSAEDAAILTGYAAGVNARLEEVKLASDRLLPKQFLDFDFQPGQWSAYDVAMVFVGTMANRFGDFNTELENSAILKTLAATHGEEIARSIFDSLNPRYTDHAPTTIDASDWPASRSKAGVVRPAESIVQSAAALWQATDRISGFSNCFVLGPGKSLDADTILVNGPQFGWFVPAYVYSIGLHGAGINVVGNTPFGYPGLLFGHNGRIAWGSTWGAGDIVDIFAETINPDNIDQYLYKGEYREFSKRDEVIRVRGAADVRIVAKRSVHGPIISEDLQAGIAFAKSRTWHDKELAGLLAWVNGMRASNFDEWTAAASELPMNINWYFAAANGDIGYAYTGHYPQRAIGHDNRFPVSGTGDFDWQGWQPFARNPKVLNPKKAYIANWNNKPGEGVLNPDEFWYSWTEADRVDNLHDSIEARPRFTPEDAWDLIESSSYADVNAPYFIDMFINAGANASASASDRAMLDVLADWDLYSRDDDGDGFYDGAATAVYRQLHEQLLWSVLADDLGDAFAFFSATGYPTAEQATAAGTNIQVGTKLVLEALRGRTDFDFLNGQSRDQLLQTVVRKTSAELVARYGDSIDDWRLAVAPRPFHSTNFLGVPQAAADEAMLAPIEQNRGTENNMIVFKDGRVEAWEVTPPGQSGFVAPDGSTTAHYSDQFDLYTGFGKKRMWFYDDEVAAHSQSELTLSY